MEHYTVFGGHRRLGGGDLQQMVQTAFENNDATQSGPILIFDNHQGRVVDVDLRGTLEQAVERAQIQLGENSLSAGGETKESVAGENAADRQARSGRPRLGVVAREVTLLPRHWEWLATQPEGASAVLRRLVENARKESVDRDRQRLAGEAVYRFMSAIGGNLPGYEAASRAFYRGNPQEFEVAIAAWPADVARHLRLLVGNAWPEANANVVDGMAN